MSERETGDDANELMALIHRDPDGGYWAEVPSLPGCFTQGETLDETVANLQEAVSCYLESTAGHAGTPTQPARVTTLRLAA